MSEPERASVDAGALERLRAQLLMQWEAFPRTEELDDLLGEVLVRAAAEPVTVISITSPVTRPARLRLAGFVPPTSLDSFYHGEKAELCASADGCCYLVYRRSDGGDYAVEWSSATLIPEALMRVLPDVLAAAMFDAPPDAGPG